MNFRRIKAVAFKEWRETVRDRIFLLLAFLLPVLWMLVFGYGLVLDVEHIPLVVVDRDHSALSRDYLYRFTESRYFDFKGSLTSETEADAWLLSGHCAHSFDCERWRTGCGECPDLGIEPAIRRRRELLQVNRPLARMPLQHAAREDHRDQVGVHRAAVLVDERAAVGVAVERESERRLVLPDRLAQVVEVRLLERVRLVVGKGPVHLEADRLLTGLPVDLPPFSPPPMQSCDPEPGNANIAIIYCSNGPFDLLDALDNVVATVHSARLVVHPVPEPASLSLWFLGLAGIVGVRRLLKKGS